MIVFNHKPLFCSFLGVLVYKIVFVGSDFFDNWVDSLSNKLEAFFDNSVTVFWGGLETNMDKYIIFDSF